MDVIDWQDCSAFDEEAMASIAENAFMPSYCAFEGEDLDMQSAEKRAIKRQRMVWIEVKRFSGPDGNEQAQQHVARIGEEWCEKLGLGQKTLGKNNSRRGSREMLCMNTSAV
jgi:hypothetical protein